MFELRKKKIYICQLGIDVGKRPSPEGGENLLPREPCKLLVIVLHRVRRCIIYNYAFYSVFTTNVVESIRLFLVSVD